jgi:carboxypeptidase Taq
METYMPPKAVEQRSEELSLLSRIHHQLATDPEISRLLKVIQTSPTSASFDQVKKRNLQLIKKSFEEQSALPEKLVSDLAMQEAVTVNSWKKAKAQKDFNLFKADLQKLFGLSKKAAEILMQVKGTKTPYEALIDNFEPKMPAEKITSTFEDLLEGLKKLIAKIEGAQSKSFETLSLPVPIENQRVIAQLITQRLGYDTASALACGRVDETEHPFTSGYCDDVRITTHYYVNNFVSSIFSVLHETGHALYEKNLNRQWLYQPVGSTCSFGIHESQSRFYENIIGRSKEFWHNFLSDVKLAAPSIANVDSDSILHFINRVQRSKIRIEADEITYSLHIIIRFEVERDLFSGKIGIDELPSVWNEKYSDYLDVKIENDSEGVMQDTHWASGLFGYFPSYALGNIYSGQLTSAISKAIPDWRTQLSIGKLDSVNEWLNGNIHQKGNLYDPEDLIKIATGESLNSAPYLRYLNEKYGLLYGF